MPPTSRSWPWKVITVPPAIGPILGYAEVISGLWKRKKKNLNTKAIIKHKFAKNMLLSLLIILSLQWMRLLFLSYICFKGFKLHLLLHFLSRELQNVNYIYSAICATPHKHTPCTWILTPMKLLPLQSLKWLALVSALLMDQFCKRLCNPFR